MTEEQKAVINKINKAIEFCSLWYSVPVDRLKAHAWQESAWDDQGTNTHVVSSDGGMGLFQIEKGVHPIASDESAFDVLVSTAWAARFLAILYKQTGDWALASKAYNGSGPMADQYTAKITELINEKPWLQIVKEASI